MNTFLAINVAGLVMKLNVTELTSVRGDSNRS